MAIPIHGGYEMEMVSYDNIPKEEVEGSSSNIVHQHPEEECGGNSSNKSFNQYPEEEGGNSSNKISHQQQVMKKIHFLEKTYMYFFSAKVFLPLSMKKDVFYIKK